MAVARFVFPAASCAKAPDVVLLWQVIILREETTAKVEADTAGVFSDLPQECEGFFKRHPQEAESDMYELFRYENPNLHRGCRAYFHEETMEYKLSECVGLFEFCRSEFIADKIEEFAKGIQDNLANFLQELAALDCYAADSPLKTHDITSWDYGQSLAPSLEGFELYIRPAAPLRITNGSYVIINYVDFSLGSDFAIFYNFFREEFFGETKIHSLPQVNYDFDSVDLDALTAKLKAGMVPKLQEVRKKATGEVYD